MSNASKNPSVTVAIPTLNEALNIENVLRTFISSKYENIIEIMVVDGGSQDNTVSIAYEIQKEDNRVRIVENPHRIQALGLNIALEQANGEIFLRADAHGQYASDYVERCVEAMETTSAWNVGGAQRFIYKNVTQAGIALGSISIFGSGLADYRHIGKSGFTDTVYLGCFKTQELRDVGGYEALAINEDYDLNTRLRKINPKAIYLSEHIKVWYYPRAQFSALIKQYFRYGTNKWKTSVKNGVFSLRSLLPPMVFLLLTALFTQGILTQSMNLFGAVFGVLLFLILVNLLASRSTFLKNQVEARNPNKFNFILILFTALTSVILQNVAFSLGYLKSIFSPSSYFR